MAMTEPETGALPPECAAVRDELPPLALGLLAPADAARVENHLRGCTACQAELAAHRQVLEAVRRDTAPDAPLDVARALVTLRARVAAEPRRTPPPSTRRAFPFWWLGIAVLALSGAVLLAYVMRPAPPPVENDGVRPAHVPPAQACLPGQAKGRPLEGGDSYRAERPGVLVRFADGAEMCLDQGSEVAIVSASCGALVGRAAIMVPKGRSFAILSAGGQVAVQGEVRLSATTQAGPPPGLEVAVAEGQVSIRGVTIEAGFSTRVTTDGPPPPPRAVGPQAAFGWVMEQASKDLSLELHVPPCAPGKPWIGTLALRNQGPHEVRIAGYHPLGVNYQLELCQPPSAAAVHEKLAPLALRRRLSADLVEVLAQGWSEVALAPGQAYELDLDLRALAPGKAPVTVVAHYLHFRPPGSEGRDNAWGYTLRSQEVKLQQQ